MIRQVLKFAMTLSIIARILLTCLLNSFSQARSSGPCGLLIAVIIPFPTYPLSAIQSAGSFSARAQMVLWYHEGHRKVDIAEMSGASRPTIDKWIDRYAMYGIGGLATETSPGGGRAISEGLRGGGVALTRRTPAGGVWGLHSTVAWIAPFIQKDHRV